MAPLDAGSILLPLVNICSVDKERGQMVRVDRYSSTQAAMAPCVIFATTASQESEGLVLTHEES